MANSADPDQLAKPTDLDLHCLQRQGISGFSRTRIYKSSDVYCIITVTFYIFCLHSTIHYLLVIFFSSLQKLFCGCSSKLSKCSISQEYPQCMFNAILTFNQKKNHSSLKKKNFFQPKGIAICLISV